MRQLVPLKARRRVAIVAAVSLVFSVASAETAFAKKKTTKKKATATTVKKAQPAKPNPGAGPATPSANANKGTLVFGTIGTSNDPRLGKTAEETRKVAETWAKKVNSAGGINGYQVKVLYKDGRGDVATALNAAKELESAGVLGIIGQTIFSQMPAVMGVAEQKKMPVVGGTPWFPQSETSPMFFTVSSNYNSPVFGHVNSAFQSGAKHFRKIYCIETPACVESEPPMRWSAEKLGMKFSSQASSVLKTDFTAECITAKSAGADFVQDDGPPFAALVRDCARQNYHPMYGNGGGSGQTLLSNAQGEQYANALYELPVFSDFPELGEFKTFMKSTDVNPELVTQTSLQTFESFKIAEKIVGFLSGPNPTRAEFLNAVYKIKGENLNGLLAPRGIDFSVQKDPNKHASYDCWTQFTIIDNVFKPTNAKGGVAKTATENWQCGSGMYGADGFRSAKW